MKYSLLHRKIPEIPAFKLQKDLNSGDLAIHRTNKCVVYFDKSKPQTALTHLRHRSDNTSLYRPSELVEVSSIYDEISRTFFDESHNFASVNLRDDLSMRAKKKPRVQEDIIQTKIRSMQASRDPQIKDIKNRIISTTRRLKLLKAGNPNDFYQTTKESSDSVILNNSLDSPSKAIRKKLIDCNRNLTFQQKLEFYDEHPTVTQRRILTSHLPWDKPEHPLLTTTRENSKFFQVKEAAPEKRQKNQLKFNSKYHLNLDYLKNPALLGNEGGKLLLQIMNDEKQNVKASQEEIGQLNSIIFKRIKKIKAKEKGWEQDIFKYAVDKVNLVKTCKPMELINSYFNYNVLMICFGFEIGLRNLEKGKFTIIKI